MLDKLIEELKIFGSLEGMQNIKKHADNKSFIFHRHILFNYHTTVVCKVITKETAQGGIFHTFKLSWIDVDSRKFEQRYPQKHFTLTSLMHSIIEAQKQIIA